uniref:Cytosol aminopeptidase n=1 Tax=Rhodnius prolixus TaxID=13249 RepID=T1IDF3_RHOPR
MPKFLNGLVLGVYEGCEPGQFTLTPSAVKFDESVDGKFKELVKGTKLRPPGRVQIFGNLGDEFYLVAASALGHESATMNPKEQLDECRENIRIAAGTGAMQLQSQGISHIFVEGFSNAEAAAEGASLAIWRYQDWKAKENQMPKADIQLWGSDDKDGWIRGIIKGEAQNRAREIQEAPANLMTPAIFAQFAQELLCPCGVEITMRDRDWIESNNMMAFLTMTRGSCEQPCVVEINYCGAGREEKPIAFVGKSYLVLKFVLIA